MANHAPRHRGGGYYAVDDASVRLVVGERGVRKGGEICLDYGARPTDDFVVHYGFAPLPTNPADSIRLPRSGRLVSWVRAFNDIPAEDADECAALLAAMPTTLADDLRHLARLGSDDALRVALEYRIAKKQLLSAASGRVRAADPHTSAFLVDS
mmetsp:Transcript_6341/g.26651  ORF Transcript_6341/g.26651 Transcript_6341/m.26651 type:complete len:154 (+) Transcript_6341:3091-3552(+)